MAGAGVSVDSDIYDPVIAVLRKREQYILRRSIHAIRISDDNEPGHITTLAEGEIVRVCGQVRDVGLVDVICGEKRYKLFYEDLVARGDLLESTDIS